MEELSLILWRERELLDLLLYKLESERLLLAGNRTRWLTQAAREVEAVLETMRETEILRAVAADAAAEAIGTGRNPSLSALADSAQEPWRSILVEHRDAFIAVTREIADLAMTNRELITAGYNSAREALLSLGNSADRYNPDGSSQADQAGPRLVDRSL